MTDMDFLTDADIAEGTEHLTLGPAYFAARRVCASAIEAFEAEHMAPIVKKLTDEVTDKLWDVVRDHLWSDTEYNLQGQMWRMVDDCVKALLSGEEWAVRKFALGERYDCEKVRAAVAKHIPVELQDARIADLEKEVARLQESLKWARG